MTPLDTKIDIARLFDGMSSMLVCLSATPDFRVLAVSGSFLKASFSRREDLIGRPLFECVRSAQHYPDGGVEAVRQSLLRVLARRQPESLPAATLTVLAPDGSAVTRHWELTHTPVHDESGALAYVLLLARDVGAAVEAQQSLRTQQALTRQILDGAVDYAIIATDLDGTVTGWNRGAMNVLGWTEAEMLGQSLDRIYLPEDVMSGQPEHERRLASRNHKAPDDGWHVRQSGERFWVSGQTTTLRGTDGEVCGFLKILRDQTEREHLAREQAVKLEALYNFNMSLEQRVAQKAAERDRIWQLSNDLMDVCDSQRRLMSVNAAWTAVLGWPEELLVGRPFTEFVHPDQRLSTDAVLTTAQDTQKAMWLETRVLHRDGRYCTMSWMVSPDQGRFYMVGRDVSQQRETEAKLRQSQKMEALGQLTGGIAHDFNNLLATITGSLELLKRKTEAGETQGLARWMQMASAAAQRASALVQRLLAFSRNQSLDLKPVDVSELTESMEDLLHRTLGENVEVTLELACKPCCARTDFNQLENALLNLAINARDAMGGRGRLRIGVRGLQLDDRALGLDLPAGHYVCLSVADDGAGMPPEVLARAFDPFFTTKPAGQGTGLGLSMIYGFAKQSGGCAAIDSQPGVGTTVSIYLPHVDPSPGKARPAAGSDPAAPPHGQECILLVEDNTSLRSVVRESLGSLGYAVHEASSAQAALMLLDSGVRCELLVTDVGLPGINGQQLAAMVLRRLPATRVLFMTGHASQAAVRADFLEDGMDLLCKPFSLQSLGEKVREMLDYQRPQKA
ncbi:PAS domain S-box protein [Xylophilus rhododendri]|uniref:histidine kinase n=1 Tax=Xylophilus rhododendri TaxID=2697032 RepID=A0A857JCY8_9BURK|nr:PAS domain-containing sensor histidine kinase [Xylophilus rhododendri]QHJ01074.1 PAS domain S-box protein [Xylophilus rhododendri]